MLLCDHHEPPEINLFLAGIEIQRGDYNSSGSSSQIYPDFVVVGGEKLVGINRKQVGEWLSSSDKVIEQIQRELLGPCEQLCLIIEGVMRPSGNGMMGYSINWEAAKLFNETHGSVPFSQRYFSVNPKHCQNEQTRLEALGVMVCHTYSLADTAMKLIAIHDMVLKNEPNLVLDRLIKPDIQVLALDPIERAFALTLMGVVGGGVGEQVALTLASSFSTIGELTRYWDQGSTIQDIMIREKQGVKTRRIGSALESKLQRALGYTPSSTISNQQGPGIPVSNLP